MNADFALEIHVHREDLLRIARLQLRDDDVAEDVVQETLLAAMQGQANFEGRAKLKTWLIGILKFRIVDALRQRRRDPIPASALQQETNIEDLEALFDQEGMWRAKPSTWSQAPAEIEQQDFMQVMELCLTRLPPLTARVFMLREMFGMESEEVCGLIAITRNHLGVLLYRARMSLRRCLEIHWFQAARGQSDAVV